MSGIRFPNDILLQDADFPQSLSDHIILNDVNISGSVSISGKLNNIDYNMACDLASPNRSPYGLILARK